MASSSSCPATYRPGGGAAAVPVPPPLPIAGSSIWGGYQQRDSGSTAETNLRKIIAIITTVLPPQPHPNALQSQLALPPPPPVPPEWGESESQILPTPSGKHGRRIDLRLLLGPTSEMGRTSSPDDEEDHDAGLPSSACSFVGEGTTKLTGVGSGSSSGVAAPDTAESGIVSASYDGVHGSGMLDSNSPEERSSEGEWDAGGGRAEGEEVKEARGEGGDLGGGEEREGRPCSDITDRRENRGGGGGREESDATKGGNFAGTEEVIVQKKSRNMDGGNERDTGRRCRRREEGYLGLLLEAVRQVSGGLSGDESPRKREDAEEKRGAEGSKSGGGGRFAAALLGQYEVAVEEEQALGPVVRSKRGRSQVLPSRYRDSVLEPWRKYAGGSSGGAHNRQVQRRQARTAR